MDKKTHEIPKFIHSIQALTRVRYELLRTIQEQYGHLTDKQLMVLNERIDDLTGGIEILRSIKE